jgi:hypothetical protein
MKPKNSPWAPNDATVAVSLAAADARRRTPHVLDGQPSDWRPPTGDTQQLVIVIAPDEMTCLGCGETFPAGRMCWRCGERDGDDYRRELPPAVRTLDYLQPGEYRL